MKDLEKGERTMYKKGIHATGAFIMSLHPPFHTRERQRERQREKERERGREREGEREGRERERERGLSLIHI